MIGLGFCMHALQAGKGKERELISWDEVEHRKDVYEAVTTPDGRQALMRSAATGGGHS